MAPIVAQGPLFAVLFSTIGGCILFIMIYMSVIMEIQRREAQRADQAQNIREANPMAWKTKPDPESDED